MARMRVSSVSFIIVGMSFILGSGFPVVSANAQQQHVITA